MSYDLEIREDATRPVLVASGELDVASAEAVVEHLRSLQGRLDGTPAAVDLSGVSFIDSAGVHALVRGRDALGGHLVLLNPSHNVSRVLEIAGVDFRLGD